MFYQLMSLAAQEKKQATKEKLTQMEAELSAASKELKARKEEETAQRHKSIKYVCLLAAVYIYVSVLCIFYLTTTFTGDK